MSQRGCACTGADIYIFLDKRKQKTTGMMNIFAARCTAMGCMELATFGVPDIKRPTHCTAHRDKLQHGRITNYHS